MTWFLNEALSSWREAVNKAYSKRDKSSDGTIGDRAHAARVSEHNPDRDGSVDAWDMDLGLSGSRAAGGTAQDKKDVELLKKEFQNQPWAQLWIHNGQIANRDVDNWKRRPYRGSNPHDRHVHWQSRQAREAMKFSGDLDELETVIEARNVKKDNSDIVLKKAPPYPPKNDSTVFYAHLKTPAPFYKTVYLFQQQMRKRGWRITVDGRFGAHTHKVLRAFQKEKKLKVDGILGIRSWNAAFTSPLDD